MGRKKGPAMRQVSIREDILAKARVAAAYAGMDLTSYLGMILGPIVIEAVERYSEAYVKEHERNGPG
jgi:hypothetical protein